MDAALGLVLEERIEARGRVRLALVSTVDGEAVDACALTVDPLSLHDGRGGRVPVGGIGNVVTAQAHRRRGLASRLLRLAIDRMQADGAAASLLYGIDGFYERFGWRSCGDERWVHVTLDALGAAPGPSGHGARALREQDRGWMRRAYEHIAASTPGAASRGADGRAWSTLDPSEVTIVERDGKPVGWAWRGRGSVAERETMAAARPGASVWAELQAVDDDAMLAVIRVAIDRARSMGDEPGRTELVTGAPDTHPLRRLARAGRLACRFVDDIRPTGGAMLLPFTEAGEELLSAGGLFQFLPDRF